MNYRAPTEMTPDESFTFSKTSLALLAKVRLFATLDTTELSTSLRSRARLAGCVSTCLARNRWPWIRNRSGSGSPRNNARPCRLRPISTADFTRTVDDCLRVEAPKNESVPMEASLLSSPPTPHHRAHSPQMGPTAILSSGVRSAPPS